MYSVVFPYIHISMYIHSPLSPLRYARSYPNFTRLQQSRDCLTIITLTRAAIAATTTAVLDERDVTIVTAIAMKQRFANVGIVDRLAGSLQSSVYLGTVVSYHIGISQCT